MSTYPSHLVFAGQRSPEHSKVWINVGQLLPNNHFDKYLDSMTYYKYNIKIAYCFNKYLIYYLTLLFYVYSSELVIPTQPQTISFLSYLFSSSMYKKQTKKGELFFKFMTYSFYLKRIKNHSESERGNPQPPL